jgi:hypothetical protein
VGPRTPPSCTATPAPPPTASQVTPFINPPQTVDSAGWHRRPPQPPSPPARPAGRTSKRSCRRVRSSSPKCLWPCRRARIAAGPGQPRILGHRFVVFVVLDIGSVDAACFPNSSRRAARPLLARASVPRLTNRGRPSRSGSVQASAAPAQARPRSPRVWVRPPLSVCCRCQPPGPEQRSRQALRLRCSSPARRHTGCAGECALGHTVDDAGGQHGRTRGLRFELHSTVIPFTPAAGWPASPGQRSAGWLQTKRGLNGS